MRPPRVGHPRIRRRASAACRTNLARPRSRYNKIVGHITKLSHQLKALESTNAFRISMTERLLDKLYSMGLISTKKSLELVDKVTVSAFCRCARAVWAVCRRGPERIHPTLPLPQPSLARDHGQAQDVGDGARGSQVCGAGAKFDERVLAAASHRRSLDRATCGWGRRW